MCEFQGATISQGKEGTLWYADISCCCGVFMLYKIRTTLLISFEVIKWKKYYLHSFWLKWFWNMLQNKPWIEVASLEGLVHVPSFPDGFHRNNSVFSVYLGVVSTWVATTSSSQRIITSLWMPTRYHVLYVQLCYKGEVTGEDAMHLIAQFLTIT